MGINVILVAFRSSPIASPAVKEIMIHIQPASITHPLSIRWDRWLRPVAESLAESPAESPQCPVLSASSRAKGPAGRRKQPREAASIASLIDHQERAKSCSVGVSS